jgi:hypothetical protein
MADPTPIQPKRSGPGEPARRPGQPGNQRETDPLRKPAAASPVTTSRLREEIDHGVGSDKVDFPDPAASPLGTDDEAAGTPPTPARVAVAARQELTPDARAGHARRAREGAMRLELWIVIAVVMVALLVGVVWWRIP